VANIKINYKLFLFILLGLVLSVMASVRIFGEDMDFFSYETYYENIGDDNSKGYEPVFNFISTVIKAKGFEFRSFLFIISFISLFLKFFVFNKFKFPIYSILIYFFVFFPLHEMTQIRVAVGLSLVFLAFNFRGLNKKSLSIITILLAIGAHYSMVFFFLFFLFFENFKKFSLAKFLVLILLPFIIKMFFLPYAELLGNVQDHVLNLHGYAPQNILSTRSILSFGLIFYFMYNFNKVDTNYRVWIYIWFFGYSFFLAFHSFPIISGRIFELAYISVIVVPANYNGKSVYKIMSAIGVISVYIFIKMVYLDPIFTIK
jgi:hypothetical protein